MKEVKFFVEGVMGKERPRASIIGGHAHIYTPKKTKDFEKKIAKEFLAAGGEKLDKDIPIRLTVIVFHGVPKSYSKKKRAACLNHDTRPMKKPDADNCLKIVADALNGIAYEDDTQIVAMTAYKYWAESDGLEIQVVDATP